MRVSASSRSMPKSVPVPIANRNFVTLLAKSELDCVGGQGVWALIDWTK